LPAKGSETDAKALLASLGRADGRKVGVDLAAPTIRAGIVAATFTIDPVWKAQLLIGWDDTDLTDDSRMAQDQAVPPRGFASAPLGDASRLSWPAYCSLRSDAALSFDSGEAGGETEVRQ
jgi:hypothetical protein